MNKTRTILGRTFKNKSKLLEEIDRIRHTGYGPLVDIDAEFIKECVLRFHHVEYPPDITTGLQPNLVSEPEIYVVVKCKKIGIGKNKIIGETYIDDSVYRQPQIEDENKNLIAYMRQVTFSRCQSQLCENCHSAPAENRHHSGSTFNTILNDFLAFTTARPVLIEENYGLYKIDHTDPFTAAWRRYHDEHSTLQDLCKKCHIEIHSNAKGVTSDTLCLSA